MVILTSWRSNLAFRWIRHCWSAFRCHDFMTLGFPIYSVMLGSKISDFQKNEGNSRSFNCVKNNTATTILPQYYQCERISDNKASPRACCLNFIAHIEAETRTCRSTPTTASMTARRIDSFASFLCEQPLSL